jgi:hypothetical protein
MEPSGTEKETSSTAFNIPNDLDKFFTSRAFIEIP